MLLVTFAFHLICPHRGDKGELNPIKDYVNYTLHRKKTSILIKFLFSDVAVLKLSSWV